MKDKCALNALLGIVVLLGTWQLAAAQTSAPSKTKTTLLATFDLPGYYTWPVPAHVKTVTFDVFGASGGHAVSNHVLVSAGGLGGEATATFTVQAGQIFMIAVGGVGEDGDPSGNFGAGGLNGGGDGSHDSLGTIGGGAGGGGSDVRIGGLGNPCGSDQSCVYSDRIIAAGGGGGGGAATDEFGNIVGYDGGAGGGLDGMPQGAGGTQKPGFGTSGVGGWILLGVGCSRELCPDAYTASDFTGGGGGWYGGIGGGGGSGFISSLATSGSFPGGTRLGDGLVVVSTP